MDGGWCAWIVATVVPLAGLAVLVRLGHSARRTAPLIVVALVWGAVASLLAQPLNERWVAAFGLTSAIVVGAPIIEEVAKAACLPFLTASRRCSWFVDGAVLGLASGTGFAIRENWLYLRNASAGTEVTLVIARITSTNLMHAGCAAIVGASFAIALRWRWLPRCAVGLVGVSVAAAVHSAFNRATESVAGSAALVTVIGLASVAMAAGIVGLGAPVSRRWVRRDVARSGRGPEDQFLLAGGHRVEALLDEFDVRYGHVETALVEELIEVHHELAIGHHAGHCSDAELTALETRADALETTIGTAPLRWLRTHAMLDGREGRSVLEQQSVARA